MRRIVIGLALLVLAVPLRATVLVPTDLGQLSRDAHAIARGYVVAVDGRWTDDRRTIETIVTLSPESYLKGELGEAVQFRVPGGTLGRFRNIVVGAPQFRVGQHVIVFLGANGPAIPFVIGLGQGVYQVNRDDGGRWIVLPPPVVPTAGPVIRGSAARRPAMLTDFERTVRELSGAAR
jgi:hypothetical protein